MKAAICLLFAVTALWPMTAISNEANEAEIMKKGEALLQANCSRCHAIGPHGQSTHPKAPPFRDVISRYPAENLAEALAEGIVSGHPDMPEFVFQADEISAILTYLDSLQPAPN